MAETKKTPKVHTITHVGSDKPAAQTVQHVEKGNAVPLRIGACVLWVVAIAFEVLALLILVGKIPVSETMRWVLGIGALVLDLVCVIIGSQLWKKANRISPASKANALKFWLWNNLGVIASVLAFVPFVILMLTNKDADGKTKTIASIVAVIALLIGGLASYDFDPISQEDVNAALSVYTEDVYWTKYGKVYHSHEDCQYLQGASTNNLFAGSVDTAIAENRPNICKACAKRDLASGMDLTGVLTEDGEIGVDVDVSEFLGVDADDLMDLNLIPEGA